ncbi:MAG: tetratricopeptide repeat protein [Elusimicrobiaceae bacterium]|nr:tetratricopeptide repeat protein [Elusimicrobiaceae bacterium]
MRKLSTLAALFALSAAGVFAQQAEQLEMVEIVEPASTAASPASIKTVGQKQWEYYKSVSDTTDEKVAQALLSSVDAWLINYANEDTGDDALLLKAELQAQLKDSRGAIVTLVRHTYEYPDSDLSFTLRSKLTRMIDKNVSSKIRPELDKIKEGSKLATKAERLAEFLKNMSDGTMDFFYEPMLLEFEAFYAKYPGYPQMDAIDLALGKLCATHGLSQPAVFQYNKISAVYPNSALRPQARLLAAGIYENSLKKYDEAMSVYQSIVNDFPASETAKTAYIKIAKLAEKQKQYSLAADAYKTLVEKYPKTDDAFNAYMDKAELLKSRMSDYAGSIETLSQAATMFKGDSAKSIKALAEAAATAEKNLKDYGQQVKLLERIVEEYPDSVQAPESLFATAEICADKLKDPDRAALKYQQVIDRYPGNSLVKKAEKALKKLQSN